MPKGTVTIADVLAKLYLATELSWDAETNIEIHLNTANPAAGTSATSECTYTGYVPVVVARSASGWTIVSDTLSNDNLIQFAQCTAGSNTATHACTTPEGSTQILHVGALDSPLSISVGIQPQFAPGDLQIQES